MAHFRAVCNCLFIVVWARSDKLGLVEGLGVGGFLKVPSVGGSQAETWWGQEAGCLAHIFRRMGVERDEPERFGGTGAGAAVTGRGMVNDGQAWPDPSPGHPGYLNLG